MLKTHSLFCCTACEALYQLENTENKGIQLDQFNERVLKFKSLETVKSREMTFYAEGLHCSSCVHLLERLPEFDAQILSSRVHFGESTVHIKISEEGSWAKVAAIIEELGYKATALASQEQIFEKQKQENRQSLMRLGVAGACAGNIMLFVVPIYAGLAGEWAQIFHWLSFVLFLPVLLYSAQPFYQGAWNFLKYRVINVDLPIVVAMWTGFALSTFNLIRGHGPVYYDSTASFLFLILVSRFALKRVQQKYLSGDYLLQNLQVHQDLKVGDVLQLRQGEKIPADGKLLSDHVEIDMSLFNGESLPQHFSNDMEVFAGSVLLSREATIIVTRTGSQTRLGKLLQQLRSESVQKSHFVSLSDRLAQYLIALVSLGALGFFLIYASVDFNQALERALALVVIACPCALAFGTPLAYGMALRKAQARGILIRDANVFERFSEIKNIFFDKTGTLTRGNLQLTSVEGDLTEEDQKIILSLESMSSHPIAFALRRAWKNLRNLPALESQEEIFGEGLRGSWQGKVYSLTRSSELNILEFLTVEYRVEGRLKAHLFFEDPLRQETPGILQHLKKYKMHILSGDKKNRVAKVAHLCRLPESSCHGELSPEQKLTFIQQSEKTCMIGDGANDSLALKAADIGIAVQGSVDLSLLSADVYFTRGGLEPLVELMDIAAQARKTVRRNLLISLLYNSIGGVLALMGFINPMVAALLMPVSSLLILFSSLRGTR